MVATECPKCQATTDADFRYCPSCGAQLKFPRKRRRKPPWRRPATVEYAGQLISSVLSGAVTALLALVLAFLFFAPEGGFGVHEHPIAFVTSAPFEERTDGGTLNASALVPIADSRFLVVDDLTDDAFFELTFTPEGQKAGPLVRRPIAGLSSELVEDLEGATLVEEDGRRFIIAVSSLEGNEGERTEAGLVRVTLGPGGELSGEVMPGFRQWILSSFPELSEGPDGPDALDVQGLMWDPRRRALLLGVKSATKSGRPLIVSVRVKQLGGAWTTENVEKGEAITLQIGNGSRAQGVYSIAWDAKRERFVVIVGHSSTKNRTFALYSWDGGRSGRVARFSELIFDPRMKPQGLTYGTIANRPAAVLVDDNGGYYVLWQDEADQGSG